MNPQTQISSRLKLLDLALIAGFLACAAFIYRGFYFPDSYFLAKGVGIRVILLAIKVSIPFFVAVLLALYIGLRRKKIPLFNVALLFATCVVSFFVVFPFAVFFYERSFNSQIEKFHPYLQLTPQPIPQIAAGALSVFCVGGSTTEFSDSEGGWVGRLQKSLPLTTRGTPIQFINAGRQWYTTQHTLINYELNLRPLHPSVIVVMQSINDLLQNADFSYMSHASFRSDYGHFHGPVNRIIEHKSIFRFFSDVLQGLWYAPPRQVIEQHTFPGLEPYSRNISTLIDLAQKDHTKVVLMTEPFLFRENMPEIERHALTLINNEAIGPDRVWSLSTAIEGMKQYNQRIRDLAREKEVPCIDLEREIPKTFEYFYDDVHFRKPGFSLVADYLGKALLDSGVIE